MERRFDESGTARQERPQPRADGVGESLLENRNAPASRPLNVGAAQRIQAAVSWNG